MRNLIHLKMSLTNSCFPEQYVSQNTSILLNLHFTKFCHALSHPSKVYKMHILRLSVDKNVYISENSIQMCIVFWKTSQKCVWSKFYNLVRFCMWNEKRGMIFLSAFFFCLKQKKAFWARCLDTHSPSMKVIGYPYFSLESGIQIYTIHGSSTQQSCLIVTIFHEFVKSF